MMEIVGFIYGWLWSAVPPVIMWCLHVLIAEVVALRLYEVLCWRHQYVRESVLVRVELPEEPQRVRSYYIEPMRIDESDDNQVEPPVPNPDRPQYVPPPPPPPPPPTAAPRKTRARASGNPDQYALFGPSAD